MRGMESGLAKLARVMSRDYDLKVRFQGDGASVDVEGKDMILPVVDSPEMLEMINGYLDHEAAHMRFSEGSSTFTIPRKGSIRAVYRILEDIVVDKLQGAQYLGCKINIDRTRVMVYERGVKRCREAGVGENGMFWMDILESMSGRMGFKDTCTMAQEGVLMALDLFMSLDECDTSTKRAELAEKIIERWAELEPPPEDGEGGDSGEDESKGEKGEKSKGEKGGKSADSSGGDDGSDWEEESDGSGGDDSEDGSEDDSGDGEGDKSDDEGTEDGDGGSEGSDEGDDGGEEGKDDSGDGGEDGDESGDSGEDGDSDGDDSEEGSFLQSVENAIKGGSVMDPEEVMAKAIEDLASQIVAEEASKGKHIPFTTEFDEVNVEDGSNAEPNDEKQIRSDAKKAVGALIKRLELALMAKDRDRTVFERDRGRIDPRRLHALVGGTSNRVFKQRVEAEVKSTAVYLLVDMSGSMGGRKIRAAREAACAFSECLERLQIPHEVGGFWNDFSEESSAAFIKWAEAKGMDERGLKLNKDWAYSAMEWNQRNTPFNRFHERVMHRVVKPFGMPFKKGFFSALEAIGDNADGESIRVAARLLAKRPEKRKVLIVFSDGHPAAEGDQRTLYNDTSKAVKEINAAGIHTIGIGIQTDAPKLFYPDHVVIHNVSDLSAETLAQLERILLKGISGKKAELEVA